MKKLKTLFAIIVVALLTSGCVYNFILPEAVIPTVDPEDPDAPQISFIAEIAPIFNSKCIGCHKPGMTAPDLTSANAIAALNNPKYINSATPEESKIYTHPHPDTGTHTQKKYTANEAALVLGWIVQGAQDN